MRNNLIILLLFGILLSHKSRCQDSLNYKSKWHTSLSFGFNIPITKLFDGRIPDNLFEYGDNSTYWQLLTVSYFFHKHWGLEFNYHGMAAGNISKRDENFSNAVKSAYNDNYYVTPNTNLLAEGYDPLTGSFERGFLGLIYRYEKKRFFIYPKLSIGINALNAAKAEAILKQRNSNNLLEVKYTPDSENYQYFIVATSSTFGYKLSKNFYLKIDLMTSHFSTDITFTKTTTDLNTDISSSEDIKYNKDIFTLSIGSGLIIVIR